MQKLKITLDYKEASELVKLLEVLTYDDVATLIERSEGKSDEIAEEAYHIWSVTDDLHRTLLDKGVSNPSESFRSVNSPKDS